MIKHRNKIASFPLDRQDEVSSAVKAAEADASWIYRHDQTRGQIAASDEDMSLIVLALPDVRVLQIE